MVTSEKQKQDLFHWKVFCWTG